MARNIKMSLLFHFNSPPNLMYNFAHIVDEKELKPLALNGRSLADGTFLIDKFIHCDDLIFFSFYELHQEGSDGAQGHRPQRLKILAENFDNTSLFADGPPDFRLKDFREKPKLVEGPENPFRHIPNILLWSTHSALTRPYQVLDLDQDQTFKISAQAVIAPKLEVPGELARIFRFDPEMVVGPDAESPTDHPDT